MSPPVRTPVGLELARSSRLIGRAFDEALVAAGGSLPVWLVLLNLRMGASATQRALAESVGVTDATITHHLNAMEAGGLLTRRRDPDNRRAQLVEPTAAGEELFARLRDAALAFDRRLRRGINADQLAEFESLLGRLVDNAIE